MNRSLSSRFHPVWFVPSRLLVCGLAGLVLAGCQARDSRLEVTSLRDPYFPETYTLQLDECAYHVDRSGDILIAGVAHQGLGKGRMPLEQVFRLHVFWRPRPGKTHDDPSTTDALLGYAVVGEEGTVLYEGTAFAYVNAPDAAGIRRVDLEDARLKTQQTLGQLPDVLGGARLSGTLYARPDSAVAMDLDHRLERMPAREQSPAE